MFSWLRKFKWSARTWYRVVWQVGNCVSDEYTASLFRANTDGMLLRNVGTDYRGPRWQAKTLQYMVSVMLQRNTYSYLRTTAMALHWHRYRSKCILHNHKTKKRINLSTRPLRMTFLVRQILFDFIHQDESGYERSLWMSLCDGFLFATLHYNYT